MKATGREALLGAVVEHVADHGISNQSLRGIAESIGTSHRMLIYHFGSREGLLVEVVTALEAEQRRVLAELGSDPEADVRTVMRQFWAYLTVESRRFGPVFFELAAHAMQGHPHAERIRATLVEPWMEPLTALLVGAGFAPEEARVRVRLGLAAARGLHHDALVTGEFAEAGVAAELFIDMLLDPSCGSEDPAGGRPDVAG